MLVFRIWAMSVWSGKEIWNVRTTTSERFSLNFILAICYPCCSYFFTPTSCKNFLFIIMNYHSYFHEGIFPLFFFIGNCLLLFIDLCFYLVWDYFFNILLFGYSNITCLYIASLRKHILWFWIFCDCFFGPWLLSKSIFRNAFFFSPSPFSLSLRVNKGYLQHLNSVLVLR